MGKLRAPLNNWRRGDKWNVPTNIRQVKREVYN